MIREYTPCDRKKIRQLYRDAVYLEPTFSCYLDKHYRPFVYEEDGKILAGDFVIYENTMEALIKVLLRSFAGDNILNTLPL